MFKILLCLRYLRTRYIALASIISVTLGVATMIVVNSVMAGFQAEMYKRLHGILSDVVVESQSLDGIPDPEPLKHEIRRLIGDDLAGMTSTVHVPAMVTIQVNGQWMPRPVSLIGIDAESYAQVGDFSKYLIHPENRQHLDFLLRDGGYSGRLPHAGWRYRRARIAHERMLEERQQKMARVDTEQVATDDPIDAADHSQGAEYEALTDPFASRDEPEGTFDGMTQQHTGIVLGIAMASIRHRDSNGDVSDHFFCRPGDDVRVTFPMVGVPPTTESAFFTVVDFYESKMSEYDSNFAFVPLDKLQQLRGMINPSSGKAAVSSIQIKLRDGADLNSVRDKLRAQFPVEVFPYRVRTWMEMQGPLLSAVQLETTILNILLFLIIGVAGFGILATFFMIVVEKTRDIGILKSLGAPGSGVMSIFMGYGLSLGTVGAGVGMGLGLLFVFHINTIAALLERATGREVFDPTVYYFNEIPTIVNPITVTWIVSGAMLIAVLASILPAIRAARLHPVEALRYE